MQIQSATLTVADLPAAATYYAEVLGLLVVGDGNRAAVRLGRSMLTLQPGPAFEGEHHVAFGIAPEDFATTLDFAREHLDPIVVDGTEVIDGPDGWDSQSVYFRGPEGIVLEYIAREAHRGLHTPAAPGGPPTVRCLSEVGIGVADVRATVTRLAQALDLPPFPPQSKAFAPVGDHDGLLIVVDQARTWFPTRDASAARGTLSATLAGSTLAGSGDRPVDLVLSPTVTIRRG